MIYNRTRNNTLLENKANNNQPESSNVGFFAANNYTKNKGSGNINMSTPDNKTLPSSILLQKAKAVAVAENSGSEQQLRADIIKQSTKFLNVVSQLAQNSENIAKKRGFSQLEGIFRTLNREANDPESTIHTLNNKLREAGKMFEQYEGSYAKNQISTILQAWQKASQELHTQALKESAGQKAAEPAKQSCYVVLYVTNLHILTNREAPQYNTVREAVINSFERIKDTEKSGLKVFTDETDAKKHTANKNNSGYVIVEVNTSKVKNKDGKFALINVESSEIKSLHIHNGQSFESFTTDELSNEKPASNYSTPSKNSLFL